jgi:antibiotic biosynthesis monooxygenase (ABM) superfamily enzyme
MTGVAEDRMARLEADVARFAQAAPLLEQLAAWLNSHQQQQQKQQHQQQQEQQQQQVQYEGVGIAK